MAVLKSNINTRSDGFKEIVAHMEALLEDVKEKVDAVKLGGGKRSQDRHVARGKLLPRDRVRNLLDPGAPFLELSQLACHEMYGGDIPGGGIITGVGRIMGNECVVVCNDATV